MVYSTFLGGTNNDFGYGVAVDTHGNAYVTGGTSSPNFTNTAVNVTNLFNELTNNQSGLLLTTNAFLTQITWNGTNASIGYSAVFGGFGQDIGYGVAVDPAGEAFVVGTTSSTNFPTLNTSGLLASTNSGNDDVFVTAFNTNGSALLYSIYFGGANNDFGYGLALDPAGDAYIAGQTFSANLATVGAFQTNYTGGTANGDAFLAKILLLEVSPTVTITLNKTNVTLTKPAYLPEYQLESNTNLLFNTWTLVPMQSPPVYNNGLQVITLPATNANLFFRLQRF